MDTLYIRTPFIENSWETCGEGVMANFDMKKFNSDEHIYFKESIRLKCPITTLRGYIYDVKRVQQID